MERKKNGFSGSSRQTSYEDIIELPHHVSSRHPQMSMLDRAAQFSPFAALTGYGDAVREKARFTEERPELSEEERARLDDTLRQICARAAEEGVTFALEPHFGQVTKSPETLRRMLDDVGAKNLRIALDMANMVTPENAGDTRALIDGFFDRLSGDIELVHAKDTKIVDGRAVFLGAGKGALDYPYLIERLKGCGYDGAVLLEYVNEAGLQGAYDFVRALV